MNGLLRVLALGAVLLCVTSCSPQYSKPLARALSAFRAGDHDALLAAKAEADEAVKTAIQPGDDLCKVGTADMAKYAARDVIAKLDQPDFFKVSEEERYLYALRLAGSHTIIQPGSFLSNSPLYRAATLGGAAEVTSCPVESIKAGMAGGSYMADDDEERLAVMLAWEADLKTRHGAKLDDVMRDAREHLSNVGYSTTWPAKVQRD